ncbi:LacI family DNA-binding transcriptional regulator [Gracilibacillus phocaeensis]|uniref:LacI family DNA-binding transcriptional regulator n=1 Tax=Gracilibacillus phocaeensis TaxID=2042304 RepID=UPI001031D211|nr:LacI family DNA-binding transcriptional regulator [Gracilibacillus phocaeensis]
MPKKVTMQDIADKLNISKNAISQALSGKPGVSDSTRALIKETANKMGYQYVPTKKSTKMNEQKVIGLIASDFAFSQKNFFGEIYLSIERELKKRNMQLKIQSIDHHTRDNLLLPSFLQDQSVSGMLIISHISSEYINRIIDTGITTVMVDHHHPSNAADAILLNNRFAAYKAVQHLIDLGHTNIGFIGNVEFSPSYQERWEGYLLALRENGLQVKEEFMVLNVHESREAINDRLCQIQQPTAWFCVNDGYGFFVLSILQMKGYQVPYNISICSFDNGELSRLTTPKTTTVNTDLTLYGKKAVEQLIWRMDHPKEELQEILLNTHLIERESTGPVPTINRNNHYKL